MQKKIMGRLRHLITSAYLYMKRKEELVEVPIEACRNMLAFSFSSEGWNYLIETLKEFNENKAIDFKETTLYNFYQLYRHEDTYSLFGCEDNHIRFRPSFGIYPWGSFKAESRYSGGVAKNCFTSRFCGPSEDLFIEKEYNNLINIYNDIRDNGYQPWSYSKSFIGGTMLERQNGEKIFVVLQGNHRTAALSYLGFEKILARYQPLAFRIIREEDVSDWYYVKNGDCSKEDALYYFDLFFKLDGNERALALGLKRCVLANKF